jgi:hypothetical protein
MQTEIARKKHPSPTDLELLNAMISLLSGSLNRILLEDMRKTRIL